VRGLAHITGDGFLNLLRLESGAGYLVDHPLPVTPVFEEIAERGRVAPAEMYEVFNMGCGFCCVVPPDDAEEAVDIIARRHPGTEAIGRANTAAGVVELPRVGLRGTRDGFTAA
jgi:phosphoribosylformylglycinamidine cyclo-ligase